MIKSKTTKTFKTKERTRLFVFIIRFLFFPPSFILLCIFLPLEFIYNLLNNN